MIDTPPTSGRLVFDGRSGDRGGERMNHPLGEGQLSGTSRSWESVGTGGSQAAPGVYFGQNTLRKTGRGGGALSR
jgi:hypothetical protein